MYPLASCYRADMVFTTGKMVFTTGKMVFTTGENGVVKCFFYTDLAPNKRMYILLHQTTSHKFEAGPLHLHHSGRISQTSSKETACSARRGTRLIRLPFVAPSALTAFLEAVRASGWFSNPVGSQHFPRACACVSCPSLALYESVLRRWRGGASSR